MPKAVRSRAPVRVGDCGGWTDVKQVTHKEKWGAVCLLTVNLYAHVLVERVNNPVMRANVFGQSGVIVNDQGAVIDVSNYDQRISVESIDKEALRGDHALLIAALKRFKPKHRVNVTIYCDAPPASGVGSSASVAVALCAALAEYNGEDWTPREIAAQAQALEMEDLQVSCGLQDQYGSALGGPAYMEFRYPEVYLYRSLNLPDWFLNELSERLVLVYVGGRFSADFHSFVIKNYENNCPETREAILKIRDLAAEADLALCQLDIERLANVWTENSKEQARLAKEIVPDELQDVIDYAYKHGACGYKVNGAGGKGTITFIAKQGQEGHLRSAFTSGRHKIATLVPCALTTTGLQVWKV